MTELVLVMNGHNFKYVIENICRVFFRSFSVKIVYNNFQTIKAENFIITSLEKGNKKTTAGVLISLSGRTGQATEDIDNSLPDYEKETVTVLANIFYKTAAELTGYRPEWGILTGIRPTKLFGRLADELNCVNSAKEYFEDKLLVSKSKISLCESIHNIEKRVVSASFENAFSLYISVPFCPSRCSYCSFVSSSVSKAARLIPQYLDLLLKEIELTCEIASDYRLKPAAIYIGGGTPTVLTAEQLEKLMAAVSKGFDLTGLVEFTVEAGRPETITEDKLGVLKRYGCSRISINPQTFNNTVLEAIGRKHTAEESIAAYRLARKSGFDNINMDIIAGLPQDSIESFAETLSILVQLGPENITLHTLAKKKSSDMESRFSKQQNELAERMVELGQRFIPQNGYKPYYLYRQKNILGNLENTGFCRNDKYGYYNVFTMDDTHNILACGASGISRLNFSGSGRIERVANYKYPYEYIRDFDKTISNKEKVKLFYEQHRYRAD